MKEIHIFISVFFLFINPSLSADTDVNVYPNPCNDTFYIKIDSLNTGDTVSILAYNVLGEVVVNILTDSVLEQDSFLISTTIDTLPTSSYFICTSINNNKCIMNRLIKIDDIIINIVDKETRKSCQILYPNPFHHILKIHDEFIIDYIEIYNSEGKLMKQINNLQENSINTSEYPSGIYVIKIKANNEVFIVKLLKSG